MAIPGNLRKFSEILRNSRKPHPHPFPEIPGNFLLQGLEPVVGTAVGGLHQFFGLFLHGSKQALVYGRHAPEVSLIFGTYAPIGGHRRLQAAIVGQWLQQALQLPCHQPTGMFENLFFSSSNQIKMKQEFRQSCCEKAKMHFKTRFFPSHICIVAPLLQIGTQMNSK